MMSMSKTELKLRGVSTFVAECITKHIPSQPMAVMDAPCGFGRHSKLMADLGHEVTSVDIDASRIETFKEYSGFDKKKFRGFTHDLDKLDERWVNYFDILLVVDFWSESFTSLMHSYLKVGGYLILQTMSDRGGNWMELPKPRQTLQILEKHFQFIDAKITAAGPTKMESETSKVVAMRR